MPYGKAFDWNQTKWEHFESPEYIQGYVTLTWLTHTWAACYQPQILLNADKSELKPNQINNVVMHLFIHAIYRSTDLATLSRCRMYAHVVYLSDICMTTGDKISN